MPRLTSRHEIALVLALLALAAGVRLPGLFSRAIWNDETISLLETAGHVMRPWPREPVPAGMLKERFVGTPSLRQIADDLRSFDIHPPLYFWGLALWRQWLGFSLETARAFSFFFSLGSVALLYGLLRAGRFEHPLGATLIYALSTSAVHNGHEARPYALATFLILTAALCGFLAVQAAPRHRRRAAAAAAAMAICCGASIHVNYLAVFPAGALLVWFMVSLWPVARATSLLGPLLATAVGSLVVPTLLQQMGTRGHQFRGFVGVLPEVRELLRMNAQAAGLSISLSGVEAWRAQGPIALVAAVGLVALTTLTVVQLRRRWPQAPRQLWTLLGALAVAPSVGLFVLDIVLDRRMHEARYASFAGPALAVFLAYGVLSGVRSRKRWAVLLFAGLLAIQATRINWGFERCVRDQGGSITRGLAAIIEGVETPSRLVVVAKGFGQGDAGSWVYELDARTLVFIVGLDSDFREVLSRIEGYVDVWITFASDKATLLLERELVKRLEESGNYVVIFRNRAAIHLLRVGPAAELSLAVDDLLPLKRRPLRRPSG